MDEQKLRKQYQEHEKQFEGIKEDLYETLQNVALNFYQKWKFKVIVQEPRLKSIDSVIAKMKRKGSDTDSLFIQENDKLSLVLNDFIGARICCNTKEDVEEIIKLIRQIRRVQLIKPEDRLDKPSGYRAVHLDVLYQVFWKDDPIYIPVEIQIKTHLQNAWSDVTHDESYKPLDEQLTNEWENAYSKHLADILDTLDSMASTIRRQRLSFVKPPQEGINDRITIINQDTLSYKVSLFDKHKPLTKQEISLIITRLKDEGFETIAEVGELLEDQTIQQKIKAYKESLRNNENVQAFEILYYGSLLKQGREEKFQKEISKDYGFMQYNCCECGRLITNDEYDFIKEKTDSDTQYFCEEHRATYCKGQCTKCGVMTSGELCKNCDAEEIEF